MRVIGLGVCGCGGGRLNLGVRLLLAFFILIVLRFICRIIFVIMLFFACAGILADLLIGLGRNLGWVWLMHYMVFFYIAFDCQSLQAGNLMYFYPYRWICLQYLYFCSSAYRAQASLTSSIANYLCLVPPCYCDRNHLGQVVRIYEGKMSGLRWHFFTRNMSGTYSSFDGDY